jgi:hypothetical protein
VKIGWRSPRHWPIGWLVPTLILNAMSVGADANAFHDNTLSWFDLALSPLNLLLVVWVASAIYATHGKEP